MHGRKVSVGDLHTNGGNARERRGLFASQRLVSGILSQDDPFEYRTATSPTYNNNNTYNNNLYHMHSPHQSGDSGPGPSSATPSALRSARAHPLRNQRHVRSVTGYGSGRYWRSNELDMEKIVNGMEKGHKVCKLLLLKKWDTTYKKISFNRETRQVVISKLEPSLPNCARPSKPQCLDITVIKDVQTLDYKVNKMKIQDKWRKDREMLKFQLDWILVISYGSSFVLNNWILLFESADHCRQWCQGLNYVRMEWASASHFLVMERWLRKQFYNIVNNDTFTITIRHMKPFVQTTLQCKVQSKQLQEIIEGEMSFEGFVLAHKRLQNLNNIFQLYFKDFSQDGQLVSVEMFRQFMCDIQHDDDIGATKETTADFLRSYLRDVDLSRDVPEPWLSTDEFVDYLFSTENSLFDPINNNVVHDMNQPLTNYWIASSHNTYLTGDQLKSESSLDAYARALMMGCRCVELDCWDGQKKGSGEFSEIVIYHGYTMTSKLNLRDVLHTIKHYAFQTSDFPVILSIEDNCSVPAQRLMALEIREILGDLLLTAAVSRDETQLPSPAALRHKIILKHKKLQLEGADEAAAIALPSSSAASAIASAADDDDTDLLARECVKRGVLWLFDAANALWERHVFVLFNDRLCYMLEPFAEPPDDEPDAGQPGDEDSQADELSVSGFGVRPEEMHVTEEWFHGKVGRDEAKQRLLEQRDLQAAGVVYLVRESGTFIGDYTLSFLHDARVHHCRIKTTMVGGEKKYFFLDTNKKDTLYELISYYTKHTLDTPAFRSYLSVPCPQPQPHLDQPWFSATADKKRAEELLNTVKEEGAFLIRYSTTDRNVFVLSVRVDGQFWHYRLKRDGRIFVVNQTVFENLNQVVDYYSTHDFVRGVCLKFPVNERTVGEYISELNSAQAGCYMELRDLEKEVEAVAIKDFEGLGADDLSLQVGTRVCVLRKDPDLWRGRVDGRVGWFPPEYVRELDAEPAAADANYVAVDLAGVTIEKAEGPRAHAFRVVQPHTHWNTKEVLVAAEGRDEQEDWLHQLHAAARALNDKLSLVRTKEKQLRIATELSALVVYCQAVPFNPDFTMQDAKTSFYEMCSFSENKHDKLLERGLTLFNARQLSRVYPQASRLTSTNLNPVPMWNSGCHMVALNYQTGDRPMHLNEAKFAANGRCGYVLKPAYLLDETFRPDLANDQPRAGAHPVLLVVNLVAGRHLSRKDHSKGICSPYVQVELVGLPTDCRHYATNSVTSNGLNPLWNECFEFEVYRPELALLRFLVEDGDFVGPKTDPFIGQAGFPLDCVRPGFRAVPLANQFNEPLELSALLVHVQVRPLEPAHLCENLTPAELHQRLQRGRTCAELRADGRLSASKKSSTSWSPAAKRNSAPAMGGEGAPRCLSPPRLSVDASGSPPPPSTAPPGLPPRLDGLRLEGRDSVDSEEWVPKTRAFYNCASFANWRLRQKFAELDEEVVGSEATLQVRKVNGCLVTQQIPAHA